MSRLPSEARYSRFAGFMFWLVKRRLGKLATPWKWVGLHSQILFGFAAMMQAQQSAKSVEPGLKSLARIQTARLVGCPF